MPISAVSLAIRRKKSVAVSLSAGAEARKDAHETRSYDAGINTSVSPESIFFCFLQMHSLWLVPSKSVLVYSNSERSAAASWEQEACVPNRRIEQA